MPQLIGDLATKESNYWLLILNVDIPSTQNILDLWENAGKIVCVDGGLKRIKKYFEGKDMIRGPDYIVGDMDSIDSESVKWLNDKFGEESYKINKIYSQESTDFYKAIKFVIDHDQQTPSIVALNCFGGRLDHTLAILNSAYQFEKMFKGLQIQLHNESCIARIIHLTYAEIQFPNFLNSDCGIIPLFGPIDLETSGLKWEITTDRSLEFTDHISTSNKIIKSSVEIENCSRTPYLWTHSTL